MIEITAGSVWWSIFPSYETANYDNDAYCKGVLPWQVKAWRRSPGHAWEMSSFWKDGRINDDSNSTHAAENSNIGVTIFQTELEAWQAYCVCRDFNSVVKWADSQIRVLQGERKEFQDKIEFSTPSPEVVPFFKNQIATLDNIIGFLTTLQRYG